MTDRERLLKVFHHQATDRVPVSPFIHINYIKEFYGSHDVDWVARTPEVYRHFGLDVIHRNCSVAYCAYGPDGPNWRVDIRERCDGRDVGTETEIRTPGGVLSVEEALRWVYEYDAEVSAVQYPIVEEADLDLLIEYQPPAPPVDVSDIKRAKEAVGDAGVVAPWIQGAFNLVAYYYRRLDDLLVDAILRPDFYHRLMCHCLGRYKEYVGQLIEAGVDVLSYGGNIANGKMVGADFFREHILPYEHDFITFIQAQGVPVLYHNCGYAADLMPVYPALGAAAYESLTPPPYGDTNLEEAVRTLGGTSALAGGIDQLDLLRTGTEEEIERAVRDVIGTVRDRCPFILGTTDYFNEATPPEKIHALAAAGRQYGGL
jgi:uroporphyrinogen decarboxylase